VPHLVVNLSSIIPLVSQLDSLSVNAGSTVRTDKMEGPPWPVQSCFRVYMWTLEEWRQHHN